MACLFAFTNVTQGPCNTHSAKTVCITTVRRNVLTICTNGDYIVMLGENCEGMPHALVSRTSAEGRVGEEGESKSEGHDILTEPQGICRQLL